MADGFADGVVAGMATNDRGYGYPMYYGGNSGFGYGGDWIWIIVLFALLGGNWGGGFGGGNNGSFPWVLEGQRDTDDVVMAGFNQAATASQLSAIQNSLNTMEISNCNRATDALQTAYQNQIADLQQNFAMQQAFANCCCENRLGLANLTSTVLSENCADREALSNGIRDIITNQTANTQKILDVMCQDKIDAKNDEIAQLRQEILYARGQASQIAQNEQIVNAIYNRLDTCPVGTTPVYGRTPIFTCNGCGCGNTNI